MQIAVTGADVRAIPGSPASVSEAALGASGDSFYASHNWHPFFIEGTKTLAFELWSSSAFAFPTTFSCQPATAATFWASSAASTSSKEAARLPGGRGSLPYKRRIARRSLPLGRRAGIDSVEFAALPTIADGIATPRPVRMAEVLRAVRRSKGSVVAVGEDEIAPALLSTRPAWGHLSNPLPRPPLRRLTRLLRDGTIQPDQTTIVVLTGTGLKAAERIGDLLGIRPGAPGDGSAPIASPV